MHLPHLLEAAIHSIDAGLLLTSASGRPLAHNEAARRLWGVEASEIMADDWASRLLARVAPSAAGTPFLLAETDSADHNEYLTLELADGRWFEQVRVAIRDEGVVTAWAWKWQDVTEQRNLGQSLQFSHDLLRKLSLRVPGIIFKFKMWPNGRSCFPYMSDAVSTMYPGVTPEAIRDDATPFFAFRHPDDAAALQASMLRSAQTMEPWDHEYRLIMPDKGIVWRHGTARPERQEDGSIAWHGFITDITERKRLEQELLLTSSVFNTSGEGIMVVDATNHIVTVNPSFSRITGYAADEVLGKSPSLLTAGRHGPMFDPLTQAELDADGSWEGELWSRRKNGDLYPQWLRIYTVTGHGNLPSHRLAIFADISEQKKADEHIWRQANFDSLTNLPNRRLMMDRLRHEIQRSARTDQRIALLFVDLDNFKEVNDTLGHDAGDQLLGEAAHRISLCVREADTVARMGGDEFTVMLVGPDLAHVAERTAQAITQQLAMPFQLDSERAFVSASIGITMYPDDAEDVDTLLKNADQAMYAAKRAGRNQHSWFMSSMQVAAARRRKLADHLRDALRRDQFEVYYQPVVDLRSQRIAKAEALLRWHTPDVPMVGPAEFIPVAEELGLINEIGEWVFQQVAQMAVTLDGLGAGAVQFAVNKSPRQFLTESATQNWGQYLLHMGVAPGRIVIEITEGLLLDTRHQVMQQLKELRDAGLQVALDDFGTGYSAMSYLLKFQLDILKIDKSFVRNINTPAGQAIVEAIVAMAHKLGLKVVAEGVEHPHEMTFLQVIGCDFAQGYLFSRPLPGHAFQALLETNAPGALFPPALEASAQ